MSICRRHYLFCSDTNIKHKKDKVKLALKEVHPWCHRHKLTIHPDKSEVMVLTKSPFSGPMRPVTIGSNGISIVNDTLCLGVKVDNKLSWEPQIDSLC